MREAGTGTQTKPSAPAASGKELGAGKGAGVLREVSCFNVVQDRLPGGDLGEAGVGQRDPQGRNWGWVSELAFGAGQGRGSGAWRPVVEKEGGRGA